MAVREKAQVEIVLSNGKKAGQTINELTASSVKLNRELRKLKPGTEEFTSKSKDLNKVKGRLTEVREEMKGVGEEQNSITAMFADYIPFSGQLQKVIGNLKGITGGFKTMRMALISTGLGALVVLIGSLIAYFMEFQEGIDIVNEVMAGLGAVVNELLGRLARLGKGLWQILNGNFSEGVKELTASFDDLGESIKHAFNEGRDIAKTRKELERLRRSQEVYMETLNAIADRNRAIADDATRSFKEREAAARKVRSTSEEAAKINASLAKKELDLVNREVALKKKSGTIKDELWQKQADAMKAQIQAESEYHMVFLDNEKQRRELKQDRLEKDLDILIDGFDNYKTINEKIIASDKYTIEQRMAKLNELKTLSTESFEKQIETIQKFTGKALNANDLLATSDARLLNEKIRNLELSEIIEGRLLEVIRERRLATSDLAEAETELNDEKERLAQEELKRQHDLQLEGFEAKKLMAEEKFIEEVITSEEYAEELYELKKKQLKLQLDFVRLTYGEESLEYQKMINEKKRLDLEWLRHKKEKNKEESKLSEAREKFEWDLLKARQYKIRESVRFAGEMIARGIKDEKKARAVRKAFAIADIGINLQQELAHNAKNAAASPLNSTAVGAAIVAARLSVQNTMSLFRAGIATVRVAAFKKGGILKGKRHHSGGIPGVVASTGEPIEMEDNEIILNRNVGLSLEGRQMASDLNVAYGGRKFESGGPINPLASSTNRGPLRRGEENQPANTNEELMQLRSDFNRYANKIDSWARNLSVNNNLQETEEGLAVLNNLRDEVDV